MAQIQPLSPKFCQNFEDSEQIFYATDLYFWLQFHSSWSVDLDHLSKRRKRLGTVYYEIHIIPLQKLGQGRFSYISRKKMWIKCLKFN